MTIRDVRVVAVQAAGVALTLVGGVGLLVLRSLDAHSAPVSVDEAVERFRDEQAQAAATPSAGPGSAKPTASATASVSARPGATAGGASGGPSGRPVTRGGPGGGTTRGPGSGGGAVDYRTPTGVYAYATTGYETADAGVSTARHDYPAETAMTVRHSGCGTNVRWDATEDRWDDVHLCLDGATSKVVRYLSFHRFFNYSQTEDFTCGGDSWFRPPSTRPGFRWVFDCTSRDAKAHTVGTVVGTEKITVGGRAYDTLHIRYDTTLTGNQRGTNPQEFWMQLDGPALLRQTSVVDADVDTPFGSIRYHEEYDLRLRSVEPRR